MHCLYYSPALLFSVLALSSFYIGLRGNPHFCTYNSFVLSLVSFFFFFFRWLFTGERTVLFQWLFAFSFFSRRASQARVSGVRTVLIGLFHSIEVFWIHDNSNHPFVLWRLIQTDQIVIHGNAESLLSQL